jgi:ABC-type Mn2+/Zn2+ transport system permease subunit
VSLGFAIGFGLLAAFTLAAIVAALSFPAARHLTRSRQPTRRGLVLRSLISLALIAVSYWQHPRFLWLYAVMAAMTIAFAATFWRAISGE